MRQARIRGSRRQRCRRSFQSVTCQITFLFIFFIFYCFSSSDIFCVQVLSHSCVWAERDTQFTFLSLANQLGHLIHSFSLSSKISISRWRASFRRPIYFSSSRGQNPFVSFPPTEQRRRPPLLTTTPDPDHFIPKANKVCISTSNSGHLIRHTTLSREHYSSIMRAGLLTLGCAALLQLVAAHGHGIDLAVPHEGAMH